LDRGDFEVTKEWSSLSTVANENQLDLGKNEAIAASMLAHSMVDGGEAAKVLDPLDVTLDTHASVEAVEASDKADNTGSGLAAEHGSGSSRLASTIGDKHKVIEARSLGGHRQVQWAG
jgi:hypothetical protein